LTTKISTLAATLAIAAAALVPLATASPAAAWPTKVQNCANCHDQNPAGTLVVTPSKVYPAAGSAYTLNITIPQNPTGTYGTGYWIANSTVAGTTGTSVVSGGSASGAINTSQTYAPSLTAPAVDSIYYYIVFSQDGSSSNGMTSSTQYRIAVDSVAPVTTGSSAANGGGTSSVAVTLSPTDATSGVASTQYRIDSGAWKSGTSFTMSLPIRRKRAGIAPGSHLVEYRSTDAAGLVETIKNMTVTLGV